MIFTHLSSFGATTLYNGTTLFTWGGDFEAGIPEARVRPIVLPNGVLYDPDGSADAAVIPSKFDYKLALNYSTAALATAEVETLAGLIGTKATLTGAKPGGGTATCTARLVRIQDKSRSNYPFSTRWLTLTFQPFTNWSNL